MTKQLSVEELVAMPLAPEGSGGTCDSGNFRKQAGTGSIIAWHKLEMRKEPASQSSFLSQN